MSSLAELTALVGFFSYSREDDEGSGGRLSKLRERIQEELRSQLGRTKADFRLWQDKVAIAHGELWEDTIKKGISESVFFIPIITPTAVRSSYCKFEFESFLAREKELDRSNLIFPILYVPVPALTGDRWRQDPLLAIIGSRQYEDWQNLRHLDTSSNEVVALRVQSFCANICRALEQEWLSREERREAKARRAAEAERRKQQEAEIKQRADEEERRKKAEAEERRRDEDQRRRQEAEDRHRLAEAEAEKRRQDEERRRLEREAKLAGRIPPEQEPQQQANWWQQVKLWLPQDRPWPLPLIGAGAALVPNVPLLYYLSANDFDPLNVPPFVTYPLYGAATGMLVHRFSIPKAVAIPIIPAILLIFLLYGIIFWIYSAPVITTFVSSWMLRIIGWVIGACMPLAIMGVWLAFWLHSLWARKQRLREAGLIP